MHLKTQFLVCLVALFALSDCKDNGSDTDNGKLPCPPFYTVPISPYDSPVWHPSGQFIGFNHTPLTRLTFPYGEHCQGRQEFDLDSTGFWLINPDGANMRRIFPYRLLTPAWSPDGQWIAFVLGRRIFKMRFTGSTFDTTTLTQVSFGDGDFFPSWRPDGQWIAYHNTECGNAIEPPPPNSCGILVVNTNTLQRNFLGFGFMPAWQGGGGKIIYVGTTGEFFIVNVTDTSDRRRLTSFNQPTRFNRLPTYSADQTKIAFWSNGELWVINSDGTNAVQLTSEGVNQDLFSWKPEGNWIVYTHYTSNRDNYSNGTLWIVNVTTGEKRQLTFNVPRN